MTEQINFGLVKPELATSFGKGYRESQQEREERKLNSLNMNMSAEKFRQLKEDRQLMLDFQSSLKSSGYDPNPERYLKSMIESGIPEYVKIGQDGMMKLNEQRQLASILGMTDEATMGSSQAMSSALPTSKPTTSTNGLLSPTMPDPSRQQVAPTTSTNGLLSPTIPDPSRHVNNKIQRLLSLGTPNAIQVAKVLDSQMERMTKDQSGENLRLSEKLIPVGKNIFDRETKTWIRPPGGSEGREGAVSISPAMPTKLKPGEVYNSALDRIEAKPGSELFIRQSKEHAKDYNSLIGVTSRMANSIAKIDKILDPSNKKAFDGNFGGYHAFGTRMISGQNSNMRKEIDSLSSDLKSAGLELMRQGGSIGQITQKEWPIVEQLLASIDPVLTETEARDVFKKIKNRFAEIKKMAADKYDTQWGQTQYHKSTSDPFGIR